MCLAFKKLTRHSFKNEWILNINIQPNISSAFVKATKTLETDEFKSKANNRGSVEVKTEELEISEQEKKLRLIKTNMKKKKTKVCKPSKCNIHS